MRLLGEQVAQARGTEHVEKESPAEQEAPVVTETRTPAPRPRLTAIDAVHAVACTDPHQNKYS